MLQKGIIQHPDIYWYVSSYNEYSRYKNQSYHRCNSKLGVSISLLGIMQKLTGTTKTYWLVESNSEFPFGHI